MENQPSSQGELRFYSPSSGSADYHPPAGFFDRLIAYLIDVFIVTIGMGFVAALSGGAEGLSEGHSALAFILYYVISHGLYGRTLGKKFLSLRVVGHETGESAGWARILLRETLGRVLSSIAFVGYLWVLFSSDRRGFHDLVSKTKVVNEGGSGVAVWKVLLGAAASGLLILGTAVYVLLFTSLPLNSFKERLELAGVEIEGLSGSLYSGFSVSRFYRSSPKGEIELNNIQLRYKLGEVFQQESLVIDQIIVGGGKIVVSPSQLIAQEKQDAAKDSAPDDSKTKKKRAIRSVHINKIDIADLLMMGPGGRSVDVKRFMLSHIDLSKEGLSWDRLYAQSEHFLLNAGAVSMTKSGDLRMQTAATLEVRPGLYEELRRPFQAQVYAQVRNKEIKSLHLSALDNRLQAVVKAGQVTLKTFDLSPHLYFKTALPVRRLSLSAEGEIEDFAKLKYNGQFYLRDQAIVVRNNLFRPARSSFSNRFLVNVSSLLVASLKGGAAFYSITGNEGSSDQYLADLYYSKPLAQLTASERNEVLSDGKYFDFNMMKTKSRPLMPRMGRSLKGRSRGRYPAQIRGQRAHQLGSSSGSIHQQINKDYKSNTEN